VGVDPAVSNVEGSDETGIVAFGATAAPWQTRHGYVLGDASGRYSPDGWARAACTLADLVQADLIVAEANNGGDLVRSVLQTVDPRRKVRLVHASRGKRSRAEPVAGLYEQGRIHHVGTYETLEDQACTWVPGETAESPDRVDALVWAATHVMLGTDRVMRTT
jgi:phage terminase large subunit-like protein